MSEMKLLRFIAWQL